jgi:hypothetical protein
MYKINVLELYIQIPSHKQTCLMHVFIRQNISNHGIKINIHIPSKQLITSSYNYMFYYLYTR